jgi:hypothetical protein
MRLIAHDFIEALTKTFRTDFPLCAKAKVKLGFVGAAVHLLACKLRTIVQDDARRMASPTLKTLVGL